MCVEHEIMWLFFEFMARGDKANQINAAAVVWIFFKVNKEKETLFYHQN